jgi:hypothetical protein
MTQVAVPDAALTAFVSALPLSGKPKLGPLVRGAVIVTRLSRPKEKTSSLSMQEKHCRATAAALGLEVLGVFQDIKSGLLQREGYAQAMQRARQAVQPRAGL